MITTQEKFLNLIFNEKIDLALREKMSLEEFYDWASEYIWLNPNNQLMQEISLLFAEYHRNHRTEKEMINELSKLMIK